MTKFKKCDYCKLDSSKLTKVKTRNKFGEGDSHIEKQQSGGGYWRQRPTMMFLCQMCYKDFFPENQSPLDTETEFKNIPEINQILDKKVSKPQ